MASALGLSRPKSSDQPSGPSSPLRTEGTAQGGEGTSTSDEAAPPDDDEGDGEEEDGESDVAPPQLISAHFEPSRIEAGETTMFAAVVQDDLAGVRSVSGVIASPTGSIQGFSCNLDAETGRFLARVNVAKKSPEGTWSVKHLIITDHANNVANLNQARGAIPSTAAFQVISEDADSSGPKLNAVWMERGTMRTGDPNRLFVDAEDEEAGVALVHGAFVSPSKHARLGFSCKRGANDIWECPVSPPSCLDCGLWQLEQIQLQDRANNLTTFRGDHEAIRSVGVDIAGAHCDGIPPRITQLELTPTVVSNTEDTIIQVRATVSDEGGCGVRNLSGEAIPPARIGGQRATLAFDRSSDGQVFTGRIVMRKLAAKGVWTISMMHIHDEGLNMRAYGANDPVLANATFKVE